MDVALKTGVNTVVKAFFSDDSLQLNHKQALVQASRHENKLEIKEAVTIYLRLADEGNVRAKDRIEYFLCGTGQISQDTFTACAGECSNSRYASYFLGRIYENGYGPKGEIDKEKAKNYYEQAQWNGVPEASYCLANLYEEEGHAATNKDVRMACIGKAFAGYAVAFNNGITAAAFRIGNLYNEEMIAGGKDIAIEWYVRGYDEGDPDCQNALLGWCVDGTLFINRKNVLAEREGYAMNLLVEAAEKGDHRAIDKLNSLKVPS